MTPPTSRPLARASEHLAGGRFAEAAGAFKAVLQIDPDEPQAHVGLGHCARARGRGAEAFAHFVRAAEIHREREENDDALGCYAQAVAADPSQLDVHVDIAAIEAEVGQLDAARQRLEGLAENYLARGRSDDAVAILEFVNQWDDDAGDEVEVEIDAVPEPVAASHSGIIAPPIGVQVLPEMAAVELPVRDTEGTMVIQTFLLTPDGRPFIPGMFEPEPAPRRDTAVPTTAPRRDTAVPTTAPRRDTAVPTAAPRRDTAVPTAAPRSGTAALTLAPRETADDASEAAAFETEIDIDATGSRRAPRRAAPQLASLDELDDVVLPPGFEDNEPADEREATTMRPIPTAAMPQPVAAAARSAAPPSVDAAGRTLAERLRSTRARTAATPAKPAAAARPTAATSKPTAATSKPAAATKPAAAATKPAAATSKPAAAKPAAAKPAAATSKPAAAKPAAAKPAAAASKPVTTGRSNPASKPASATSAPRPATTSASRPTTRTPAGPTAAHSTTASIPAARGGAIARPSTSAPVRPTGGTRPATPSPGAPRASASASAPARPSASPRSTTPTTPTTTASPKAAPARPAGKPAASPRATTPTARAGTGAGAPTRGKPQPTEGDTIRSAPPIPPPGYRADQVVVMRPRGTAPGVPAAVTPSATLPMVIPAPGRDDIDDQHTVLYRGDG